MNFPAKCFRGAIGCVALGVGMLCLTSCDRMASAHVDNKDVITLTKANFQTEVLASSQPVLVDFWASWCGPCRVIAPSVAELATELKGKAKVGKVDVDAETELAKQYDISGIPALLIFKDGKQVEQMIGVRSKAELKAALEKFVADTAPTATTTNL